MTASLSNASATPTSASTRSGHEYELISGEAEIAKGVTVIESPGHTAGHVSLLVELNGRRPMLFTGDAVYTRQKPGARGHLGFPPRPGGQRGIDAEIETAGRGPRRRALLLARRRVLCRLGQGTRLLLLRWPHSLKCLYR